MCFLFSGAAGLLYEVVWGKQLAYLLGSSLHSVATVVAAFLGGLALGARFLGTRLARRPGLARVYATLEVGIAVLGLALLPVLRSLDGPVGQLYRLWGGESPAFAVARVVLLFAVLVPPAALMGATLPVLVARIERGALGAGLARLYAINTLGAVLGSVLGGYLLMPGFGLTATTIVAAALNLAAALLAFVSPADEREASRAAPSTIVPVLPPTARRGFALLFAITGCTALLLQLAWVRLFGLVLGSSVYSFSSVLGIYLLGLGLGSAAAAPLLARRPATLGWFSALQCGIAFSSVAGLYAYGSLPKAMLDLGERAGTSWAGLLTGELLLVAMVLFVPCLLMGAVFPIATRLLQDGTAGETTGTAYAINTIGTIAGSLGTGFFLLPALGVQGVVLLAAALGAMAGLVAWILPGSPRASRPLLIGTVSLAALTFLAGVAAPRWDPLLMSLGTFRPFSADHLMRSFQASGGSGDPTRALIATQRVRFYEDGINTSVLVVSDSTTGKLWMRVGGKVDAGTGDMLTQVMLGLIPSTMAERGARTLVVGHGSGVTAAASLAAGSGPMDIVELEPAVVRGSRFFHEPGEDPLDDRRVTLHMEDARTLLEHGAGSYGVIISEPSNPWMAGVNNLFTVDFYQRVRARLEPEGVFCQWLQLYELSPQTFESLLASFLQVFPEAHLFCLWGSTDALLIAAPPGRMLSLDRLRDPSLAFTFARAGLRAPEQIAAFYVGSGDAMRAMAKGGELNTDERPFVEYQAPRDMIEVGRRYGSHHPGVVSRLGLSLVPPPAAPLQGWPLEVAVEWRARQRMESRDPEAAALVSEELRQGGFAALAGRLEAERAQPRPGEMDPLIEARALLARGEAARAKTVAARALAGAAGPARLEPLIVLGIAEFAGGHPELALGHFSEAQSIAPRDPRAYNFEARVRITSGDAEGARRALARGLANIPGDSALVLARRALDGPAALER